MSSQLIKKLLEAEQQAEAIVRRAKENHAKKIKEAETSAEEDMKRFRAHEEEKFKKELASRSAREDQFDALEDQTKAEIEQVKAQFKKHRDAAVGTLIRGVVRVDLSLSEVEIRQLRHRFAQKTSA